MNKKILCLFFFFLTIASCNLAFGQEQEEKQPLAKVLIDIEKQYNVKFSFETKTIEGISISPLYPELSLDQVITQLKLATQLNFEILSDRFIAITPKTLS